MKWAFLTVAASFLWLIGGAMAVSAFIDPKDRSGLPDVLMYLLLGGFVAIFLTGTALWGRAKGYPAAVGVILGWLGPLGLLILACLPGTKPA